jgi:hypothetical protein
LFVITATLLFALSAFAQSTVDGAIAGTVTDPSKAVVPGATVSARNVATNASASAKTDDAGHFTLQHLAPGVYEVEVKSSGLASARITALTVEIGRPTPLDVTLAISGTAESVTVADEAPVVNTEQQDFATNINQTSINNLPINGRRWFNFALGTPGTATDGGFGDISFRGISGLLNNNTVDGGDNNQAFFSEEKGRTRIAYSTSQESIQEFQVNTAAYSAEYGRAAGGVVNAVTKSGTNQLHGDGFYLNRDNTFGAFTPFAVRPALVNGSFVSVPVKPTDIRQQFGGDLGGYLIKDKLFFYYNFDSSIRHFPAVATPNNPGALFGALSAADLTTLNGRLGAGTKANLSSAQITQYTNQVFQLFQNESGTVPRTGDQVLNFPKLDWRVNQNHTVSVSYNRLRWDSPYGVQTNSVVARGLDSYGDDFVKSDTAVARVVSIFGPRITNEFRIQIGRDFEYEFTNAALAGVPLAPDGHSPQIDISGTAAFTWGQPTYTNRYKYPEEKRTQVADTASYSLGKHLIKVGLDVNHVTDNIQFLNNNAGNYSYNNRIDFMSDYIASQIPAVRTATGGLVCGTTAAPLQCYQSYSQALGPLGFSLSTNEYGMFVQDQWRIKPRLTLNIGVRYELELLPSAQIPNPLFPATGTINSDKKDIGPRVGFAWDVNGNGKTSVRGGYGIYYGRIINGTLFNAITSTGVSNGQVSTTISPNTNGAIGPIYPNVITSLAGTVAKPSIIFMSGNLRNPMVHQYDLVVERQIAANTSVSLSWIGSLGHFLPAAVDINLPDTTTPFVYNIVGGSLDGKSVTVPFFKGTRPNTNFNQISQIMTRITSVYNAGVAQINRRMSHGFQVQGSYTWADSVDDGQGTSPTLSGNSPSNPRNLMFDRGPSNFDIRHRFSASAIYQPGYHGTGMMKYALAGWTISPIFFAQSGAPFSPTVSGNPPSGAGNAGTGVLGAQGSTRVPFLERNSYRLPRTANMDLRISKAFPIRESFKFELIGEMFNVFNHVNYTGVVTQMFTTGGTATAPTLTYNPSFGTFTSANNNTVTGPRQIQIGARFSF